MAIGGIIADPQVAKPNQHHEIAVSADKGESEGQADIGIIAASRHQVHGSIGYGVAPDPLAIAPSRGSSSGPSAAGRHGLGARGARRRASQSKSE